jgi:hypothetical protein
MVRDEPFAQFFFPAGTEMPHSTVMAGNVLFRIDFFFGLRF